MRRLSSIGFACVLLLSAPALCGQIDFSGMKAPVEPDAQAQRQVQSEPNAPASGEASVIRVPGDQPTIQAAVDAAVAGDSILLSPGNYLGCDILVTKQLAFSVDGGTATIAAYCAGRVFNFSNVAGTSSIENIRFCYGNSGEYFGGAVRVYRSQLNVADCVFDNNRAHAGGAVYAYESSVEFTGCEFIANVGEGGAVYVHTGSSALFDNCVFTSNLAQDDDPGEDSGGAILAWDECRVTALGCEFTDNEGWLGGAISANDSCTVEMAGCVATDNRADQGAFLNAAFSTDVQVRDCLIHANTITDTPSEYSGIVHVQVDDPDLTTSVQLTGNTLALNDCGSVGSGFAVLVVDYPDPSPYVLEVGNNLVANNDGAAFNARDDLTATVSCNDFFANSAGDWTGPMAPYAGADGNLSVDPLFCDPADPQQGLADWSPCLNAGECGVIGSLDAGCSIEFAEVSAGLPVLVDGSVEWGDYDNDEDLDFVITGISINPTGYHTRIYRNDGGSFTDIDADLFGVFDSSVSWGDCDGDGDLDLLLSGRGQAGVDSAAVYRNDDGVFTDVAAGLPGKWGASVAWGDYDNDGDLDILLTGDAHDSSVSLFRNGAGTFVPDDSALPGFVAGSAEWGDYDKDGDLDILLTGYSDYLDVSRIYRNDGGEFTDIEAGLIGVSYGSGTWGDYDADGDLDILLAGYHGEGADGGWLVAAVYRNDAGVFTDIGAGLLPTTDAAAAWGDYDNDGDLDIMLAGRTSAGGSARVYRNDNGSFADTGGDFTGVTDPAAAWGDYDGDGDLDLLVAGNPAAGGAECRLYRNLCPHPDAAPAAPANLAATVDGPFATFGWDGATDPETPAGGLSYNLRIGSAPGGGDILAAMSDPATGLRRVARAGNCGHRLEWTVALPEGDYYWSVQAVDGGFAGSPFAPEAVVSGSPTGLGDPPGRLVLLGAVPNPFNPRTSISFELPEPGPATLRIYDLQGGLVRTVVDGMIDSGGVHAVEWDGRSDSGRRMPSGAYLCRLTAGGRCETRSMMLVK